MPNARCCCLLDCLVKCKIFLKKKSDFCSHIAASQMELTQIDAEFISHTEKEQTRDHTITKDDFPPTIKILTHFIFLAGIIINSQVAVIRVSIQLFIPKVRKKPQEVSQEVNHGQFAIVQILKSMYTHTPEYFQ